MSIDKFRFVSPGVQVAEIDLSRRTRPSAEPGPVIIGRFERGPTMRPVKVDSLNELEEIFGRAITGRESGDISRNGNFSAPSYAAFAANAWLANQGGATIVRLVGKQADASEIQTGGEAGWTVTPNDINAGRGGAWGLWVTPSASAKEMTGTLGAIFYCEGDTGLILSGTRAGDATTGMGAGVAMQYDDANIHLIVKTSIGHADNVAAKGTNEDDDVVFNFNPQSRRFIRKAFNTTPHNTNSNVVKTTSDSYKRYWLGESFEDRVQELVSGSGDTKLICFVAPLVNGSVKGYYDHLLGAQEAKSGWVISQDVTENSSSYDPANMQKLFRFCSLEEAEWTQKNLKISIRNIRLPNSGSDATAYGSFDVQVRKIHDSDAAPEAVETYAGVNLNPASPNYIANRIGDQYAAWSDAEKRYRYFGAFPNNSKYIRVDMASAVEEGSITREMIPFGFFGMPRPATATAIEGEGAHTDATNTFIQSNQETALVAGQGLTRKTNKLISFGSSYSAGANAITASYEWPTHKLVQSASMGSLSTPADRYFGVKFSRHDSDTLFDHSVIDLAKMRGGPVAGAYAASTGTEDSFVFSLDDVSASAVGTTYPGTEAAGFVYVQGSRATAVAAGRSVTAVSGTEFLLDQGYDKFTLPLFGGFDGLELKEMAPLINNGNNGERTIIGSDPNSSYERYTIQRAIDTVSDPEIVDMNLLTVPGVAVEGITDHMINTCERRRDCMAIIDIPHAYSPRHEDNETDPTANNAYAAGGSGNSVTAAVAAMKRKGYNSSYAAAYYPWVQVRAPVSGLPTWSPPSVVALGAMSYGQATQAVWFAPAGFTRGGLTEGRGGLPVVAVSQRLSSKERDKLYEVNINPIAQFPAEGIVIFGQKTLQATPSALDRINVRRLLIFIKKRISTIASRLLFEPNVSATWGRFTGQVVPLLDSIKTGFGLDDFRVVLDETTTTADLIDRNTLYAKIFVKPTKAIEFIAIDFIITRAGASFDD